MAPLTAMLAELGDQNGSNMVKISDPKINRFFNGSSNRFFMDFSRFWYPKWTQVGTNIGRKIDVNFERPIFLKYCKTNVIFMIFEAQGSKLEEKIDQKSMKKRSPRWNASG